MIGSGRPPPGASCDGFQDSVDCNIIRKRTTRDRVTVKKNNCHLNYLISSLVTICILEPHMILRYRIDCT